VITGPAGYNEYKFKVTNAALPMVRTVLTSLYGGTDPYPEGIVDSIYYDTLDRRSYFQCFNGEARKTKFRIRGYGDGKFAQIHLKEKNLYGVAKLKAKITPVAGIRNGAPDWEEELHPLIAPENAAMFSKIMAAASHFGPLVPAVRVRYHRYRFRMNDYRITLDTNVEVMSFSDGRDRFQDYAVIPYHVLEVKTMEARPHLPLLGLLRLPQISYSKFFLGLGLLREGVI